MTTVKMTAQFTKAYQMLLLLLQLMNAVNVAQLPHDWQVGFTGLLSILMAVQGILAHYFAPSGEKLPS